MVDRLKCLHIPLGYKRHSKYRLNTQIHNDDDDYEDDHDDDDDDDGAEYDNEDDDDDDDNVDDDEDGGIDDKDGRAYESVIINSPLSPTMWLQRLTTTLD